MIIHDRKGHGAHTLRCCSMSLGTTAALAFHINECFSIVINSFIYIAHVGFFSSEAEELDIFLPPTNAATDVYAKRWCLRSLVLSQIGGLSVASSSIRTSVLRRCERRMIMIQTDMRVSLTRSKVQ